MTVLADTHELRIVDGAQVIACHHRSYYRGEQIEQTEHLQALIDQKRGARQHRATNRLAQVAPASQDLLVRAAERGANLGAITHGLMRLLDRYGAADLQAAIREALERDVPHPSRKKESYLQAQFQRLRHRREPKKAICAVAASILTAVHHMLRDGTFHQDLDADHFRRISPESQASRLARQIAQLGFVCTITPAIEGAVSV